MDEYAKAGAKAFAAGAKLFDNPFFRRDHMPQTTGDTIEIWNAKLKSWERGWREASRGITA